MTRPVTSARLTLRFLRWLESRNQRREHRSRVVPAIEAELELFSIAPKMFRADADVRSLDAAFEVTPEAFDLIH